MRLMILSLLILASCASPAPEYFGATRHDLEIDGIRFAVFVKESEAEVIRLGYLSRKDRARVPELMMQAASQASGCEAIANSLTSRIPGDTGEGKVSLRC
ncbi:MULTISPECIES: hypothetical protein [Paracoccus]|uniref:Lipoprotein n=1 Tax=Paracoccus litorisediminis TaxID=2006130 RepID=A0A844HKA1_9RHOB|nr:MULTISPECIES: hypothetical protein [Paracoccus]MBD9525691.1 hypothetical protein [Paracoccus sp. PAR01]MTH58142.1 hypothetical protein [Paracoccus litorisediminis]